MKVILISIFAFTLSFASPMFGASSWQHYKDSVSDYKNQVKHYKGLASGYKKKVINTANKIDPQLGQKIQSGLDQTKKYGQDTLETWKKTGSLPSFKEAQETTKDFFAKQKDSWKFSPWSSSKPPAS